MRSGGRKRRPGLIGRWMSRVERRVLSLAMRVVAAVADRQMRRYHEREAAAADAAGEAQG